MTDDREVFKVRRDAGLKARHEQRLENATYTAAEVKVLTEEARRQLAEEIATAIEVHDLADSIWHGQHIRECAAIAREIGAKEASA